MDAGPLPVPADFRADTEVEAAGDGRYRCELGERWNAALYPFGGVVVAIALRAAERELADDSQRLRTATALFVSPVTAGPLEVHAQRLRVGRTGSQLSVSARSRGSADGGLSLLAAFGREREGFAFTDAVAPEAPPPERCPPPGDPPLGYQRFRASFFEQVETRNVRMRAPWETGWEGGRAEAVRWMRFRRAPRLADGTLDPLALVALSDTMPPSIGQRLGPEWPHFYAPSIDHTVHPLATTRDEWLLVRSRCRHAGEGYASAECEIWSQGRRLLLYATQLMMIRLGSI
ncbi:MAG TPA: thioesterase family protein [Myxococcota bacterium]|nr:thioesterase family protein [Myxococcota bacterium]